ncbi:hypothetical protein [Halosimplex pelagicum]|uniref:Sulfatase-like hydrolase/transferase n=1 Tax=Halosimplex pelagicum TaxID=869886 RepID=A0A7D5TAB3_9EURY|nr:hypothetical protein [Halosimplex pelagicum]QLH81273.1 hypothetical protein HZS54_06315 [Halosimplex pelagicum]
MLNSQFLGRAARWVGRNLYQPVMLSILSHYPVGMNVYDREWDLLILLDTCRTDALQEVASDYDFIENVNSIFSVGSSSLGWMCATFDQDNGEDIEKTAYISANGWAGRILQDRKTPVDHENPPFAWTDYTPAKHDKFGLLDHAWQYEPEGVYEHEEGYTPARYVTERAISVSRDDSLEFERTILHYNQPHSPYTAKAFEEDRELKPHESDPFEYLRSGGDKEVVWESYIYELRAVLDEVELLLENVDAESVVISADHGEAFGEMGIYGHPTTVLHPVIRNVPWVQTTASDKCTHTPEITPVDGNGQSAMDNLKALGYVDS